MGLLRYQLSRVGLQPIVDLNIQLLPELQKRSFVGATEV
ncbi:hypothetical protein SynPROS91_02817 [Synechococcus sp. PROS-9-1]|nr:hypothetical protein SynPROS91_02817 [Synechococcus sp. PROS-9-1]